ncbi:MAG: hypothetical protein AVDCRST_MAG64-3655 [uncultured Phycisphaerae bacterium]|uniref:Uncharacterized protein n=1 Tax=uncultured Phycisphaerae bacterium TaxID=904963 RepID=A0A6J4Q5B3_9BACT|nr:MAG: hypothetical protein AVDCRST_MAG64-3655 [uncultured Phycisphaerae bacterium]
MRQRRTGAAQRIGKPRDRSRARRRGTKPMRSRVAGSTPLAVRVGPRRGVTRAAHSRAERSQYGARRRGTKPIIPSDPRATPSPWYAGERRGEKGLYPVCSEGFSIFVRGPAEACNTSSNIPNGRLRDARQRRTNPMSRVRWRGTNPMWRARTGAERTQCGARAHRRGPKPMKSTWRACAGAERSQWACVYAGAGTSGVVAGRSGVVNSAGGWSWRIIASLLPIWRRPGGW